MPKDELKDLPPRERIKRLKELEQERKKEIEEAQQLIKESEEEISAQEEWVRKVPIPQIARDSFSGLSREEKEMLEAHKGTGEKNELLGGEEKRGKNKGVESILDLDKGFNDKANLEVIAGERIEVPKEFFDTDYSSHLSQLPVNKIREELYGIRDHISEKGYMSEDDQRQIKYRLAGLDMKTEAGEMGTYKSFSEEAASQASMAKQLGADMLRGYVSGAGRGERMYRGS